VRSGPPRISGSQVSTTIDDYATVSGPAPWNGRQLFRAVLDRLFPWFCVSCTGSASRALCDHCLSTVRWITEPCCPCCGLPLATPPSHLCARCAAERPAFDRLRALACYRIDDEDHDPIGRALRALKYGRRRALAASLSAILAERFPFAPDDFDCIAPVPLHVSRLRERGFNQALLLAREPARRYGRRLDAMLLERVRQTSPQVGLGLADRRKNLRGAFRVRDGRDVAGLRVLVADDVSTSGATADACATALIEAGARSVDVVTLARTLPH
jgi:ComF family protein